MLRAARALTKELEVLKELFASDENIPFTALMPASKAIEEMSMQLQGMAHSAGSFHADNLVHLFR